MNMDDAIQFLEQQAANPSAGLPEGVFEYVSRTTPLVNVDLLIHDEAGRILLSWRDDQYAGTGWHVPGGIIRFKESWEDRVRKVAETEIGADVQFDPTPIAIYQFFSREHATRGHFVSLLFKCVLPSTFVPDNKDLLSTDIGYVQWHAACPDNLVECQNIYRAYM